MLCDALILASIYSASKTNWEHEDNYFQPFQPHEGKYLHKLIVSHQHKFRKYVIHGTKWYYNGNTGFYFKFK